MTQDEIIEMARQAWVDSGEGWVAYGWFSDRANALEAFAKLVVAKEREACAKVCDGISERANGFHTAMADDRNEEPILYMTGKELGASNCADAIRARGEA
jgi:hypothetical protein